MLLNRSTCVINSHISSGHRGDTEEGKIETPVIIEQRTVLALKNNLLYDLALAPNIEVEIPLNRRWSVNAESLHIHKSALKPHNIFLDSRLL